MALKVFLVEDSADLGQPDPEPGRIGRCRGRMVADGEKEAKAWLVTGSRWHMAVIDLFLLDGSGLGVLAAMRSREPQ